jgi:hypothetical protein
MSEPQKSAGSPEPKKPALVERATAEVRREPVKTVASAFVLGLILSIFPVGRVISAIVSLGLMLLRPALMIFGAAKAREEFERRGK